MSATKMKIPFDPDSTEFPRRADVPRVPGAPAEAAWVWGPDDQLGRLNLLTPKRIKASADAEIRTGEMVSLCLPLNEPHVPSFARQPFEHKIVENLAGVSYDDLYSLNTQSGTQWDGFRHFAHMESGFFYNGARGSDFLGPDANNKCSVHYWHEHGMAGRGVLLDFKSYADANNITYNCFTNHGISYEELVRCGKAQGLDIRPESQGGDIKVGDMLFIRSGWTLQYSNTCDEVRDEMARRPGDHGPHAGQLWAGVKQEDAMLDWLHDCWFATVAGDSVTFEAWPPETSYYLHEYLLALWGVPNGEMANLEVLAVMCKKKNRWTFFVQSCPARCYGGVGTHTNATAFF